MHLCLFYGLRRAKGGKLIREAYVQDLMKNMEAFESVEC